jgi:sugar phosphate isomerase/epimerase
MQTSRRAFLAAGIAGGALGVARCGAAAEASGPRWKCGLGLNGFMSSGQKYQKSYPIWEVLDFAAAEGFDGIELVDGWPMGGYPGVGETARIRALNRMYDQYGLQLYSMQTGGEEAHAADPGVRQEWLRRFHGQLQVCRELGGAFLGHWPGGGMAGNPDVDHALDHLAASYHEAAQLCADAGMHLSFEIEPPFIFNTLEHLERILAGADHRACRTNYDPSHFDLMSGSTGKPEEMLKKLGVQHIGHVHLTDTDGTLFEGTSKHLPCGEGHCDIAASLDVLWEGGYTGWIMIDGWMIEDVYHAARKGKQAIDAALKRHDVPE